LSLLNTHSNKTSRALFNQENDELSANVPTSMNRNSQSTALNSEDLSLPRAGNMGKKRRYAMTPGQFVKIGGA
jgi:hypothetical protein